MSLSKEIVEIDPRGDLILHVTSATGQRYLKVCSRVLCLTSPVFRTMLESPDFKEGIGLQSATTESPFKIQLHDDHYESLLIVVNMMHFRGRQIPSAITLEVFYQLAIVCDKYNVAEIFLPWIHVWTGMGRKKRITGGKWLVIAWVFRLGKHFEDVTKGMIYDSPLEWYVAVHAQEGVETGIVPDRVFSSVRAIRQKTAGTILSLALRELDRYKSTLGTNTTLCQVNNQYRQPCAARKACDNLGLGTLVKCLLVAKLWPISMDTASSIQSVLNCIVAIENQSQHLTNIAGHVPCCPSARLKIAATEMLSAIKGLKLSDFCQPEEIFVPI